MYKSSSFWRLRPSDPFNCAYRLPSTSLLSAEHLLKCSSIKRTESKTKSQHIVTSPASSHRPVSIEKKKKKGKSNNLLHTLKHFEKAAEARGLHLEGEKCTSSLWHHPQGWEKRKRLTSSEVPMTASHLLLLWWLSLPCWVYHILGLQLNLQYS